MNRILATAALAGALTAGTLAAAPSAHAEDHRPCVSKVEYREAFAHDYSRRQLERLWEVRGLGSEISSDLAIYPGPDFTIAYPRCGFDFDVAWFAATYAGKQEKVVAVHLHRVMGVPVHGHP